jgi:hypothetical protein
MSKKGPATSNHLRNCWGAVSGSQAFQDGVDLSPASSQMR